MYITVLDVHRLTYAAGPEAHSTGGRCRPANSLAFGVAVTDP